MGINILDLSSEINRLKQISLKHAEDVVSVLVLETEANLKSESPVDTGRFRANWFTTEETPSNQTTNSVNIQPPYSGYITLGKKYYITNNLPYAEKLANGSSPQAPAGWIDLILASTLTRAKSIR